MKRIGKRLWKQLCMVIGCLLILLVVPGISSSVWAASELEASLVEERLTPIAEAVEKAIKDGKIPGAVILIGTREKILYRQAFGCRSIEPEKVTMTTDTIFDLASLTKVISTSTAIMQLMERGKLRLADPVATYWPEFKTNGKERITVRQLLTHYSGLRPDLDLKPKWSGYETAMKMILNERPVLSPGTGFIYSDINFEILGELVARISGQPLDIYCTEHIFKPLGMKDTGFKPSSTLSDRFAPTQYHSRDGAKGKMLLGEVHDPAAYRMGGVTGHAGLFSTADDLAIFAQMLLNGGSRSGRRILSPLTVEKMTTPQTPPSRMVVRGLGWDIDSPFSSSRGELFPVGSYGHTGFTGTSIWIDPISKIYVIILTNQVHPDGRGDVKPLRAQIATITASALGPLSEGQILESRRSLTGYYELMRSYRMDGLRNGKVRTGIDVLKEKHFSPLAGLRVGLITNHSGLDSKGNRTIDLLYKAPGVKLVSIFSPEHGLSGQADARVDSTTDTVTGLPVYSLYGNTKRPNGKMMEGLDALVFDIQDIGIRFYTYITTMGYAMEAAAKARMQFFILDRPNPLNSFVVQGPLLDKELISFTGYFPMPVRHGMTIGELAQMFKAENEMDVKLHIIKMEDYNRTDWYDETGLPWVNPSPNIRTLTEAILYPGVAMAEGANVSVGRGTDTPFELLGAPWIKAMELAVYLNNRRIQGLRFIPVDFTPRSNRFENQVCHGVQINLIDRQELDIAALGIEIASALYRLYPGDFRIEKTLGLIGSREVLQAIKAGQDPHIIGRNWQEALEEFRKIRARYLIY